MALHQTTRSHACPRLSLCAGTRTMRGAWVRSRCPVPQVYPLHQHDHHRSPSVQPRFAPRLWSVQLAPPRPVPRSPRAPAAHVSTSRAFDAPLGHSGLPPLPGACQLALRRLPGRDSHPLNMRSRQQHLLPLAGSVMPLLRDAPCEGLWPIAPRDGPGGAGAQGLAHSGWGARSLITTEPFSWVSITPRSSRSFMTRLTISREAPTTLAMS